MRIPWKTGVIFSTRIYVTDAAGAAVTDLIDGGFTKQLSLNDANSGVAVTVTEIDKPNLPGHYKVTFTPTAGYWHLRVAHATYNKIGWEAEIQATDLGLGYSSASEILEALLDVASAIDGSTIRNVLKWMAAVLLGKGGGTAASPYRSIDDTADRVSATYNGKTRATVTKS